MFVLGRLIKVCIVFFLYVFVLIIIFIFLFFIVWVKIFEVEVFDLFVKIVSLYFVFLFFDLYLFLKVLYLIVIIGFFGIKYLYIFIILFKSLLGLF